jgi:hypothetical protein
LDVLISCASQSGQVVNDLVRASVTTNPSEADVVNLDNQSLASQVAGAVSPGSVFFSGDLQLDGKCYGEDNFYRVFVTPNGGNPVVSAVSPGVSASKYGVGDPNVRLRLLYWAEGPIPQPVQGSIVAGQSDAVQGYNCTSNGDFRGYTGTTIDGGVIYGVGQIPAGVATSDLNTASTTASSTDILAEMPFGAAGVVSKDEASANARKIKPKDDGFLGTGLDLKVVLAVAGVVVGCFAIPGVGCSIAGGVLPGTIGAAAGYGTGYIVEESTEQDSSSQTKEKQQF